MRVLFDQGVPSPLRDHLPSHEVQTAFEHGWAALGNGELLSMAEKMFDILVTTDTNLKHQQNLAGRRIAIMVLPTTSWPRLQRMTRRISEGINSLQPGQYLELTLE